MFVGVRARKLIEAAQHSIARRYLCLVVSARSKCSDTPIMCRDNILASSYTPANRWPAAAVGVGARSVRQRERPKRARGGKGALAAEGLELCNPH